MVLVFGSELEICLQLITQNISCDTVIVDTSIQSTWWEKYFRIAVQPDWGNYAMMEFSMQLSHVSHSQSVDVQMGNSQLKNIKSLTSVVLHKIVNAFIVAA